MSEPLPPPSRPALLRLVRALVADQIARETGRPVAAARWSAWTDATPLDEEGVGADSLTRLALAARLNQAFELFRSGVEDYLLLEPRLGGWVDLVADGLARAREAMVFQSSGSTGTPSVHAHPWADLEAEVAGHLALLGRPERVLTLVPPHHIYGFLFTLLLPERAGCPVVDLRAQGPAGLMGRMRAGDLVVATPHLWQLALEAGQPAAGPARGVTSGAPAPAGLWAALAGQGLAGLVEIYGASETAGLGWRDGPAADFTPLAHLATTPAGFVTPTGRVLQPPDHVLWTGPRFRPAGRRDGMVQVAGVNVSPAATRDHLLAHPGVAAAAVRLDGDSGRLKAFVVPAAAGLEAEALAAHCRALPAPARPVRFDLGPALPVNEIGKLADWMPAAPAGVHRL